MLNNTLSSYGWVSILLHWLSAIVVIGLFAVGFWMVDLNYYSEWYRTAPMYHKSVGILFVAVIIFRVVWRLRQTHPVALGSETENRLASAAHGLLYLLLFSLFISGYLISTADGRGIDVFNWFAVPSLGELIEDQEDIAGLVHEWLAYSLIGLALLHAVAALKHHFVNKDETLKRILKPIEDKS